MLLSEIKKNIETKLSINGNSGYISFDKFNTLLEGEYMGFVKTKIEELFITSNGAAIPKTMYSTKLLGNLIKSTWNDGVSMTGTADSNALFKKWELSTSDFMYWLAGEHGTPSSSPRGVELVTEVEFVNRRSNLMAKPIDENPIAFIKGGNIFTSNNVTAPHIYYIKTPTTPFLDYYIDADSYSQTLDVGDSINLSGAETGGQYRDGTTTGTKNSTTVELEISFDFHLEFQNKLMEAIAIPIDTERTQYANIKQQQESAI